MKVVVYTSPLCQPCRATKRVLTRAGIPFTEIDLTLPEHAATLDLLKGRHGDPLKMPLVVVTDGGTTWSWQEFRPDLLNQLELRHKGYWPEW